MENKNFDVQELIEKATPKDIMLIRQDGSKHAYICPTCSNVIIEKREITNYHLYKQKYYYCHSCGQKLSYDEK